MAAAGREMDLLVVAAWVGAHMAAGKAVAEKEAAGKAVVEKGAGAPVAATLVAARV
jgi:hypothetical protein